VGIPEEKLKSLLTYHTEERRGIGLLNTDKRLKQQFGSGVDITSVPNRGTTVTLIVPKKNNARKTPLPIQAGYRRRGFSNHSTYLRTGGTSY